MKCTLLDFISKFIGNVPVFSCFLEFDDHVVRFPLPPSWNKASGLCPLVTDTWNYNSKWLNICPKLWKFCMKVWENSLLCDWQFCRKFQPSVLLLFWIFHPCKDINHVPMFHQFPLMIHKQLWCEDSNQTLCYSTLSEMLPMWLWKQEDSSAPSFVFVFYIKTIH